MEAKIKRGSITRIMGTSSMMLLSILMLALVCPSAQADVSAAEDEINVATGTHTTALVESSVSIALAQSVDVDVVPNGNATFATGEAELLVTTNNLSGYQVFLTTADNSQELHPLSSASNQVIAPVNGMMTADNFTNNLNTWGYALVNGGINNATQYRAVPKSGSAAVISTKDTSQNDSYTLSFGVAVGSSLPAGRYTNDVLVSVIANPRKAMIKDISTMQEMTPELCAETAEGVTTQLVDTRDSNTYWVGKLADGKCWMQQNLDLDIKVSNGKATSGTGTVLTNENTNISTANWSTTDSNVLAPTATATTSAVGSTDNAATTSSWDAGKIVLNNPTGSSACSNVSGELSALANCEWFTEVSTMRPTYTATETASISGDTYDAHYLIGNWYSWGAATAGTSKNATSAGDIAAGSICPKGWRLPSSEEQVGMLNQYGITSCGIDGTPACTTQQLMQTVARPVYAVRSGAISPGNYLDFAGVNTYFWSNMAYSSIRATYYHATLSTIRLDSNYDRRIGVTLRCIAE